MIPCRNEKHYLRQTLEHILNVPAGASYEVIVVDDGSGDGCCDFLRRGNLLASSAQEACLPEINLLTTSGTGAARARNLGAAQARARHIVFCDAHVIVSPGWLKGLLDCLEKGEADAVCPAITLTRPLHYTFYGGVWDENLSWVGITSSPFCLQEVPLAPSGCLAVRRSVFRNVGGFEGDLRVWGFDDAEFSLKLWLFGFKLAVHPRIKILHISRPSPEYQRRGEHLVHNLLLLALLHFSDFRLAKTVMLAKNFAGFTPGLIAQLWSRYSERRADYLRRRVFSDDWFMHKFKIPF